MLAQQEAALRRDQAKREEQNAQAAASGQDPVQLSRQQVNHAYDILEQGRIGPYLVKYGCMSSVIAIAYTYLRGFQHYRMNNKEAWLGTFRQRIFILGPVIAAYTTSNGIIPLPFKEYIEEALHRRAICMYDIVTAKETVRKAQAMPLSMQSSA